MAPNGQNTEVPGQEIPLSKGMLLIDNIRLFNERFDEYIKTLQLKLEELDSRDFNAVKGPENAPEKGDIEPLPNSFMQTIEYELRKTARNIDTLDRLNRIFSKIV